MCTASDFYMKMGQLIQELISDEFINVQKLMQTVYQMAPFPWNLLKELREKYTYDIHPFTTFKTDKKEKQNSQKAPPRPGKSMLGEPLGIIWVVHFLIAHRTAVNGMHGQFS